MIIEKEVLNPEEDQLLQGIKTAQDLDEFVEHLRVNRFTKSGQEPLLLYDYPEIGIYQSRLEEIIARPASLPSTLWYAGPGVLVPTLRAELIDTDLTRLKIKNRLIDQADLVSFLVSGEMRSNRGVLIGEMLRDYTLYQTHKNYLPGNFREPAAKIYGDTLNDRPFLFLSSSLCGSPKMRAIIWQHNLSHYKTT